MENKLCCVLAPIAECRRCGWLQCRDCPNTHEIALLNEKEDTFNERIYCPQVQKLLSCRAKGIWILGERAENL